MTYTTYTTDLLRAGLVMIVLGVCGGSMAGEPRPVPRFQAIPLPHAEIAFARDGVELARYHFHAGEQRPFVYPILGPSGICLTRMGHPHDPESHSHHNSFWVSHHDINGISFWEDRTPPRIAHRRILKFTDGDEGASIEVENAWLDRDGKAVLRELRRIRVQPRDGNEWMLVLDLEFSPAASQKSVTFGQTPFGLIGVRMAKTIGVHDGGGTITNSEGGIDEAGCFRKPARWCDYSGPVRNGVIEGITLLDHPQNLNHPVPFHVRDDGWMGAALTLNGAYTIQGSERLRLRYALFIHANAASPVRIEKCWREFAATDFAEFTPGK
jgi:hypothetical protein